jgi:hypothetical protein
MTSRRLAALILALPLLGVGCGGSHVDTGSPFGNACQLHIRGTAPGANEDLWCVVSAVDYADLGNPGLWAFELVAYRGTTQVAGGVGIFLPARPTLGTSYGWTASTTSVESGSATRSVGDAAASPPTVQETHLAIAPMLATLGTGSMAIRFSRIPPLGATGPALMDVHGTLSGTLAAMDGVSPPVTFAATF